MRAELTWIEGMQFTSTAAGNAVTLDAKAPIGRGAAQSPKELVLSGLSGCTAMDVVSLLRKHKQSVSQFTVETEADVAEGYPAVFTAIRMVFKLEGTVDPTIAVEAVTNSQTRYCAVSAMLSKACPITWTVLVNGAAAGTGQARF